MKFAVLKTKAIHRMASLLLSMTWIASLLLATSTLVAAEVVTNDTLVDVTWKNGKLASARIQPGTRGKQMMTIRYGDRTVEVSLKPGSVIWLNSDLRRSSKPL